MLLFTTKPVDQLFERLMKYRPNFKPDASEGNHIQVQLDAEKKQKGKCSMIYPDARHQHVFEKESALRPSFILLNKKRSVREILNDNLIHLYRVVREHPNELQSRLRLPHQAGASLQRTGRKRRHRPHVVER